MQEYIPVFIMNFMWAVSIVLCSVCKNSKFKDFGSKNLKNERWKNTKKSDQILGQEPLKLPLLSSNVPNWLLIRIWDFASAPPPFWANVPKFTFFYFLKASLNFHSISSQPLFNLRFKSTSASTQPQP